MNPNRLAVILHGGAGSPTTINPNEPEVPVMRQALDAAWGALLEGKPGECAVVEALRVMEGCEYFDAGYGSYPNEHGRVRCDVALMRGNGDFMSLLNMQRVKFPSQVAADLLSPGKNLMAVWTDEMVRALDQSTHETKVRYGWVASEEEMVAPFALEKARERQTNQQRRAGNHDTVGCVVRDGNGRIFAGTSTGGILLKPDGRIGDAPILGAGVFADDALAGLSATGHGEAILKSLLSGFVVADIRSFLRADGARFEREPELLMKILAAEIDEMSRKYPGAEAGLIVIPARGMPAYHFNSKLMPIAVRVGDCSSVDFEEIALARQPQ